VDTEYEEEKNDIPEEIKADIRNIVDEYQNFKVFLNYFLNLN